MNSLKGVILLLCLKSLRAQEFSIPRVTLEAFQPSGFQASILAEPGIEIFGFHGKKNKPITQIEPGDFNGDVTSPVNGYFTYYNPKLNLTVGDEVNYWIYVQHNQLGYRRDALKWKVEELRLQPGTGCAASTTRVSDRTKVCADSVIFEDNFSDGINEGKWTLEQYIPSEPDYEFVIYKKDSDVAFVKNKKLCIKPKLISDEEELKKTMDLRDGCTKAKQSTNCIRQFYVLQNPIISARLTSKVKFSYGKFEIKARLPTGDWIFPEVYLEDDKFRRIYIAYARGNSRLTGSNGVDIGGSLLFGGPAASPSEPERSKKLSSHRHRGLVTTDVHTFSLVWTSSKITLFMDGINYGTVTTDSGFTGDDPGVFRLVIGVGVGGLNDFPDHYKSVDYDKPWVNAHRKQVKQFYSDKDKWYRTWGAEDRQLEVEYVKVTAV